MAGNNFETNCWYNRQYWGNIWSKTAADIKREKSPNSSNPHRMGKKMPCNGD